MKRFAALVVLLLAAALPAEELKPFEASGLFGYKNRTGQTRIPARFAYAGDFKHGVASVIEKNKAFLIDEKGRQILEIFLFDNGPDYFKEGLARFVEKGKMGYFDERGRKVIPALYDFAYPFSGQTAEVCNGCKRQAVGEHFVMEGGTWMSIDKQGRVLRQLEQK